MTIRTVLLAASGRQEYLVNKAALAAAERWTARYGEERCIEHPDRDPELVIHALPSGALRMDRSGFCCEGFARRFDAFEK